MNHTIHKILALLTAVIPISICGAYAAEEEVDPVAALTQPQSSVSVGIGHWSGDREQFGGFDNIRDSDSIWLLDADVIQRNNDEGSWLRLNVRDLGLDNRELGIGYEIQGNWGIGLDYDEIVRMEPYMVNTGTAGIGSQLQTIATPQIAIGSGRGLELGTKRKRTGLNFFKYLNKSLSFSVDFKNEKKDGDRHWSVAPDPYFIAEPIDSTTRQLDVRMNYAGKELQLNGGYYGSWYDNHNSLVTAFTTTNLYMSLPLDNAAHQFFINGGYNFTPTTRGTFRVSYTHATMDERLPTADIAGLAGAGAPASIDGEVNTTVVYLGLSSQPMKNLSVVANLRYHDVDDKTPAALIAPGEPAYIKPNDYKTISGKLEGTYRLKGGYSLIGGMDIKNQDRSRPLNLDDTWVPFRTDLDEKTYRVQLRKSLSETVNGSLAYLHSERDGSTYIASTADPADTNLLNPVNIADRDRDKWRVSVDWMATDRLALQFNYEDSDDDYGPGSNAYGLTSGSARLFSADADFAINDDWHLNAWVSWDETKASQEYFDDARSTRLKDTGNSLGLGIKGKVSEKLKLGADLAWTRTKSYYDDTLSVNPYSSGTVALPDIKSTATRLSLFAEYAVAKNADLRFDIIHERWKTDDWTWAYSDGSPFIYGDVGDIDGTSVIADPNQSATYIGVRYKYKFK